VRDVEVQESGEEEEEEEAKLNVYANAVASAELLLRGGGGGGGGGGGDDCGSESTRGEETADVRLDLKNTALAGSGETRYARPCLPVNPLLMI